MVKLLVAIAVFYSAIVLFFYVVQRKLIYFPSSYAPQPLDVGVGDMRIVELQTNDGITLRAWYKPAATTNKPTIVYFHGNAGNIGHRAMHVKPFLQKGYGVLLVTYRGYSQNPSYPSEEGLYLDAQSALNFLQKQKVNFSCIALYGESIGCAVAIEMATKYPVGALILLSPFTSLVALGKYHYPFLPISMLLKDRYNSLEKASYVHTPTLIIHGKYDNIVPVQFGQKLYEALDEPKEIQLISDRGHNDLFEPALIMDFLMRTLQCQ